MNSTLESLDYSIHKFKDLFDQKKYYEDILADKEVKLNDVKNSIQFIKDTKEVYVKALDIVYKQSIGVLKDTLNTALKYIIYDKNYSVNMTIDDKRGTKALDISLVDEEKGFEVDLLDGVGQGVRTIISFVLKYYYLMNKGSNILLLDEKYSALSAHYVPRFFEFILSLCEKNNTKIVLITHDERFMEYANKTYLVNDGYVTVVDDGKEDENKDSET